MFNVKTLNNISEKGLNLLTENYEVNNESKTEDAILLRSFKMHDYEMPETLKAIGRAGAGVNNIPLDKCAENGIVVFNAPGANANAVKELVILGMLLSARKVYRGIEWCKTLGDTAVKDIEKGKKNYAGNEIMGKTLTVVGLGAIGALVSNAALDLGMNVVGYDPFLSPVAALRLDPRVKFEANLDKALLEADYVTVHVPLMDATRGLLNKDKFAIMKEGVKVLNFARGGLVNEDDVIEAVKTGKVGRYVTDFPSEKVVNVENIIAIPHLGASTEEAEENCAIMATDEIMEYLENGNITHSVNYPDVNVGVKSTANRVAINHTKDFDVTSITGIKADSLTTKTRGDYGYTVIDTDGDIDAKTLESLAGVIRVRVL